MAFLKWRLPSLLAIVSATTVISCNIITCAFSPHLPRRSMGFRLHTKAVGTHEIIEGPPLSSKPDYSSIHGPFGALLDRLLTSLFRSKLASRLCQKQHPNEIAISDSTRPLDDFQGIIEITHSMNSRYANRTVVQSLAQDVLVSLFPPFILNRYPSWFARPFPGFSSKMCAYATVAFGTWLMGECEVNDIPSKSQGVLVKRCRFLEESQCASICVNSCKIPTQNFFRENMGLGLTMTPNYETGECQFAFGVLPTEEEERDARKTPCLSRCPSGGGLRGLHNDGSSGKAQWLIDLNQLATIKSANCVMMDDLTAVDSTTV